MLSDDYIQMLDNENENIPSEIAKELVLLERQFTIYTNDKYQATRKYYPKI